MTATVQLAQISELPSISIVVPNYNGGTTLQKTLQSLIDQNYPNLEIIVVDGGSTDNSVEIIRAFESHIAWWVSEKDRGQSHAINKGFARCTGEIVNWLCSDDLLAPGALHTIGRCFAASPDVDVLVGASQIEYLTTENPGLPLQRTKFWLRLLQKVVPLGTIIQSASTAEIYVKVPTLELINLMPACSPIHQPSCFYRQKLLGRTPPLGEDYVYTMDIELFNYFKACGVRWQIIEDVLSIAPISGQNKSSVAGVRGTYELEAIYKKYTQEQVPLTYWHRRFRYPLERFLKHNRQSQWVYLVGPLWVILTLLLSPFYGFKKVWALRWTAWV
jgi:glycosyltransferase involved in cell wall biosynthesis